MSHRPDNRGISLLEMIFAMGIFSLLLVAVTALLISGVRWNGTVWDQLASQSDGRKTIEQVTDDLRRADDSSIGSYPIASATSSELIFYANIDNDTYRERVRYTLATTTIVKGVVKPSGNPLRYTTSTEMVTVLAKDVKNRSTGVPLFQYFDANFTGTQAALPIPVSTTLIRAVRVQVDIERDANKSPVPFHIESLVHLRNIP